MQEIKTNAGRIADQLREDVISGRIDPGERLTVSEVAARFGTSGAPVREAFQNLSVEGLLELPPNKGAIARNFSIDELRQIFTVRAALEGHQAFLFASVATDEQISELRRLAEEFAKQSDKKPNKKSTFLNAEFHQLINAHDGNQELLTILKRHSGVAAMMRRQIGHNAVRLAQAANDHFSLVDAIEARDQIAARDIAIQHVEGTFADILKSVEATQVSSKKQEK